MIEPYCVVWCVRVFFCSSREAFPHKENSLMLVKGGKILIIKGQCVVRVLWRAIPTVIQNVQFLGYLQRPATFAVYQQNSHYTFNDFGLNDICRHALDDFEWM